MLDNYGRIIVTDDETGVYNKVVLATIGVEHWHIHRGWHFSCQGLDTEVDIDTPKNWLIVTPDTDREFHLTYTVNSSKGGILEFFEGVTTSADGSELTPYNNKRSSSNTSILEFYEDPTVTDTGTRLCPSSMGTSGVAPTSGGGGIARRESELELLNNTKYLIRVTPYGNDAYVSLCCDYYELLPHPDDGS